MLESVHLNTDEIPLQEPDDTAGRELPMDVGMFVLKSLREKRASLERLLLGQSFPSQVLSPSRLREIGISLQRLFSDSIS